ncbi:MAG TPA: MFS transporter [Mycobacteriales bacterium]|nr:MFS transporter [Mycobacteriales bacterium]
MSAGSRRAWAVWGLGVLAYTVAVFHRSSLGVAGLDAQERFAASAAVLSLFGVLQLGVYAALQIPVGVLLDRAGPRRLLVAGGLLMAAGQLVLAQAAGVPAGLAARVLVGAGDALTFISVLRLVAAWFPARRVPVVTQLTGLIGQGGQVVAAFPLVAGLHGSGWTPTFTIAAAVGALVALLVAVALRDAPPGVTMVTPAAEPGARRRALAAAWREPGTRLGLWTHFVAQFSGTVFALFWGYPFLVEGQGLSPAAASALLTGLVLAGMAIGPVMGWLAGRWPLRRSAMVLGLVGASALAWTAVLAWPGRAPLPLLVLLVLVLASNGPGSMVGFDFARTENPPARLGSASGIVNVGGFVASLTTILAVGLLLDLTGSWRVAMAVQFAVWAVGLAGLLHTRRVLRRRRGIRVDPLPRAVVRRLAAARS